MLFQGNWQHSLTGFVQLKGSWWVKRDSELFVLELPEFNSQRSSCLARLLEETLGSSLTCDFLRPFPNHQQSHPANQPAEETGLSDPWHGYRRLHHPPPALRFTLNSPVRWKRRRTHLHILWRGDPKETELSDRRNPDPPWAEPHSVGPVLDLGTEFQPTWTCELVFMWGAGGMDDVLLAGCCSANKRKRTRSTNEFLKHYILYWLGEKLRKVWRDCKICATEFFFFPPHRWQELIFFFFNWWGGTKRLM